jgi:hypothetical protein
MNFARALLRDLVAKRLWPVAALLAVAMIAVPLLIGSGGSADDGSPAPAAAVDGDASASAPPAASRVKLVGPASVRSRPGKVRDPFRRPKPKVVEDGAKASAATSTETSKGTAAADTSTTDSTQNAPATLTKLPFAYRTEVRFGPVDRDAGKAHGISRLTPLGGPIAPALLYLGVSGDGEHATFLLGPTAQQFGEGRCLDPDNCRIIVLKAGMSTVVDVTPTAGDPRQYSLDVVSVQREGMPSAGIAAKARAHVHPDGRDVLRDVIGDPATAQAIGKIVYDQRLGVLVANSAP